MDLQELLSRLLSAKLDVGATGIYWREIIGNGFGLASALLGMRRKVAAWPIGIVGNVLLFTVFISLVESPTTRNQLWLNGLLQLASSGVFLLVLLRFGMLATVVMYTIEALAQRAPLTLQSNSLYAGPAWTLLGFIFLVALAGLWMARRGDKTTPGVV